MWASATSSSCTTSATRSAISRPRSPSIGGLTDLGKKVVQECNRLGILVDLAHSTPDAVTQALAVSKAPVVWSHSSVTRTRKPQWIDVRDAGPATEPGGREGHRGPGRRGRPVGAAVGCGPRHRRLTPTDCPRWPIGWARITSAFGTDMNGLIGPALDQLRRSAARRRPLGAAAHEREPHPQARHRELRARARQAMAARQA